MNISKQEAIELSKGVFSDIEDLKESEGKFLINKNDLSRDEVISRLQTGFDGKNIINGCVSLSPLTLVFTSFEITDRH